MTTIRRHRTITLLSALPLLLAGMLLAACSGGGPPVVPVAQGTAAPAATPAQGAPPGDSFGKALAFSQCMRSHGVPNFPDPKNTGNSIQLTIGGGSGIDPKSPQFQSAQQTCQSLAPGGKATGGGSVDVTKIAPWAQCIRSHGVPNFPDPKNNGGSLTLDLTGSGIKPDDPAFRNAIQACKSQSPGGGLQIRTGS